MKRDEYLKLHEELCKKMVEITKKKNNDYSRNDDPFANFKVVEAYNIPVEVGFLTRMSDKMSRLSNYASGQDLKVTDESIEDTLLDLANYSLLCLGYIKSKKAKKTEGDL
jgi:hypothetical protein